MTSMSQEANGFRIVRLLAILFLANAIILPLLVIILPLPDLPPATTPSIMSLIMMILMPLELFLVYILYQLLGKKTNTKNIPGIAALLFVTGTIPSVYGFAIGFTDPSFRFLGAFMGLVFGLSGMFLAWKLINRVWDSINADTL
ncbi:MAG: hypothetical protein ACFFD3_04155 [Candidatus Thorarchaeota archaeon]